MIYLIVGRTGSGKDYLANKLVEKGFKAVKSYSTRPPRYEGEDSHIFISKEESPKYTDKVATTQIGEFEYFATAKQVNESDIYIIDPKGLYELTDNMPDETFVVIYVFAEDDSQRKIRAIKRVAKEDKIKEEEVFDKRNAAEDEQFTDFEHTLFTAYDDSDDEESFINSPFNSNVVEVMMYANKYDADETDKYVKNIIDNHQYHKIITQLVEDSKQYDIFETKDDKFAIASDENTKRYVTAEYLAKLLISNPNQMVAFQKALFPSSAIFADILSKQAPKKP